MYADRSNLGGLPNVTMVGDAAQMMPPFAGEGANMAIMDALELSEPLTADQSNTLQEAIGALKRICAKEPQHSNRL